MSGYIYEKRLLLKYVQENGTDPMSNEALNPEQLIEVKCNIILKYNRNKIKKTLIYFF